MHTPKDILVTTSSTLEGLPIQEYLKPVTAHIVAGTGLVSDFLGSITDVFGGRSQSYQKQLTSLYNEAIERLKLSAYELGANCIIGLKVDMDEISGKGKSMFMITAIGTAVIIDKLEKKTIVASVEEKLENVSVDRINTLHNKRFMIQEAIEGKLSLDDDAWSFLITNQVDDVFPFILKKFLEAPINGPDFLNKFKGHFLDYLDALPQNVKETLLYDLMNNEQNEDFALRISEIIRDLNLLNLAQVERLLRSADFIKQKRGLRVITYDKPFYNKGDIQNLLSIKEKIETAFHERGERSKKKQLLSSKEKEIWICECGKSNEIENGHCYSCNRDIYGFTFKDISPNTAVVEIDNKISLISEFRI